MSTLTPPKYRVLGVEKTKALLDLFKGEKTGWVQVGEKNWLFPYRYAEQGEGFFNFEARPSDVWVLSYPRSGTTWTQELVWLVANDMDFDTANTRLLAERFPFLEFSMFHHPELTKEFLEHNKLDAKKQELCKELAKPGYEVLANMPSPRFIKSHFPFSLIPNVVNSGCKMIYVARNPKDVAVSWYKLNQAFLTQGYVGDFAQFWKFFKNDLTAWSPYWEHLKEAWDNRKNENLLFIFYEELQENLRDVIERVAKFLGKAYSMEQVDRLVDHLSIDNFRKNLMVNTQELKDCGIVRKESEFVRRGVSGGWKDYFTDELEIEADEWIEKSLKDTDLRFPLTNNNWF
ncbi:sulfotransferase family cytosolic 1B member 1-like [Copidosoma floridanum]|uniref:sulfotransferase family cytosolic 1B member 1-like n=1 Tax=Copidosoma floridanum TaxID=29053 RepID=UPI0006C9B4C9|nr:sulfotransferase family cytosolic 1B member 1-like [Copidosoma floridanum]